MNLWQNTNKILNEPPLYSKQEQTVAAFVIIVRIRAFSLLQAYSDTSYHNRTHSSERPFPNKISHDHRICNITKLLKKIPQNHRQRKKKQRAPGRVCQHIVCFLLHHSFVLLFCGIFLLFNPETLPRYSFYNNRITGTAFFTINCSINYKILLLEVFPVFLQHIQNSFLCIRPQMFFVFL